MAHPESEWHLSTKLWPNQTPATVKSVLRGVYWVPTPDPGTKWLEQFKITGVFDTKKSFDVLARSPTAIGVPRFWGLSRFGVPKNDERTLGPKLPKSWFEFDPHRPLRGYQNDAILGVRRSLDSLGGAVIHADCAIGKTAIAMAIHSIYGRRTLFISHRDVLIRQTIAAAAGAFVKNTRTSRVLQHVLPFLDAESTKKLETSLRIQTRAPWLPQCRFGVAVGRDLEDTRMTDSFVVGSLSSLSQFTYPKAFYDSFGLVIVDEAHHIGSPTFSQVLGRFPARFVLGLTATPERSDGTEYLLFWLMGPVAYKYQRSYSMAPLVATAPTQVVVFRVPSPWTEPFVVYGRDHLQRFIQTMSRLRECPERNDFVVRVIVKTLESRKCVLVVSYSLEQVMLISEALGRIVPRKRVGIMSRPIKTVGSEDNPPDVIVAVDECSGEGWDFPPIDTVVFASPPRGQRLLQQSIGRGERPYPGKKTVLVVDIQDLNTLTLRSRNERRLAFYKSRSYTLATPPSAPRAPRSTGGGGGSSEGSAGP